MSPELLNLGPERPLDCLRLLLDDLEQDARRPLRLAPLALALPALDRRQLEAVARREVALGQPELGA